jgi:hypothetical protein
MGEAKSIQRIVQKKATREYYAGPYQWVLDPKDAKRFDSVPELLREMGKDELQKACCVLIMKFDGKQYDLILDI